MIEEKYLQDILHNFRNYKKLAEKSFAQVSDEEFFRALDEEANSIAVISKHIAGNLRSRWTDFLTTDGEKPDRNRDLEFVAFDDESRAALMEFWENGWRAVLSTIENLQPADLAKTVKIRGEDYSVVEAINRATTHTAYHVGQIVFLAKHLRAGEWQNLSVPRNKSAEFNAFLNERNSENDERLNRFESGKVFAAESEQTS